MFYSTDKTEDLSPGHSISDNSKGTVLKGQKLGHTEGFATNTR